jgi:hypothetical protein
VAAAEGIPDEARADRRVVIVALSVMVGLVLFGVGFGSLFAATNCRQLRPIALDASIVARSGDEARALLAAEGLDAAALSVVEGVLGPLVSAVRVPLDAPLGLGPVGPLPGSEGGVLVTGDGVMRVDGSGDVVAGATFRRAVTVVGDGAAVYALVVGNTLTGQVDALRPLIPGTAAADDGFTAGTCVDTSAVGSPLAFLHDAREGVMLGLRTDEDGSDAVLELRDPVRGRVWAPVVEQPRAPAGLQGSRTSGAIGPDTVVMVRRIATDGEDPAGAVRAFGRTDGALRWELDAAAVRAALATVPSLEAASGALADAPTLRLEVAAVATDVALIVVYPDVAPDAPLPHPVHGSLGQLAAPDPRTVTLVLDLADGSVREVVVGPPSVGRDGADRARARDALLAAGVAVVDVLPDERGAWLLVGRSLARLGG